MDPICERNNVWKYSGSKVVALKTDMTWSATMTPNDLAESEELEARLKQPK
jgi:hypothetical protein